MKLINRIASALIAAILAASPAASFVSATPATAENPQSEIDCRYVRFDNTRNMATNSNASIYAGSGNYKIISEGEDAPYLSMLYDSSKSNYAPYRLSLKFAKNGYVNIQYKYVRITYRTKDTIAAQINMVNTATEGTVTLVENTSVSKGEWVTSPAVDASRHDMINRFAKGGAIPIQYTATWKNADLDIREIVFFKSIEDAYAYYGEEAPKAPEVTIIDYGVDGNGSVATGANYGKYEWNTEDGCLDIVYAEETNFKNIHYMAKLKAKSKGLLPADIKYVRVEYYAKNPEGVTDVLFTIECDATGAGVTISEDLQNTDGFVVTPPLELNEKAVNRWVSNGHSSATTNVTVPGGIYKIKALYFFTSLEDAESYTFGTNVTPDHEVKIAGNDISKYQIVISDEAPPSVAPLARAFNKRIKELTGSELPIVTDLAPESEYEILIGQSSRKESYEKLFELLPEKDTFRAVTAYLDENKLVMTSMLGTNLEEAVNMVMYTYLGVGVDEVPDTVTIDSIPDFVGNSVAFSHFYAYETYENIAAPQVLKVDFESDEGYFSEDSGLDYWTYANGKYKVNADGRTVSYVHVWEANVKSEATVSYSAKKDSAKLGLLLRYTDENAYIKAGYDFDLGEWFIDYREGEDFFRIRAASVKGEFKANTDYKLTLTAYGGKATLLVDGKEMLTADVLHITTGEIGFFADNITASADDYRAELLSGLGTVMRNVTHIKLPDEAYREGGTVVELTDGTFYYQHHSGVAFKSADDGKTWAKCDVMFPNYGYQSIIRLNNGELLQIGYTTVDGVKSYVSFTSADDGKTWVQGGVITPVKHPEYGTSGGNMNDKVTQSGTTNRIFYSLNYEGSATINGNKLSVYCEYFYSDDNGKTWTKSETASYNLEGNIGVTHFGENKILQCADGTVRMYASWHKHGEIVYAESTDGGKTFGPMEKLEGFTTSHASMQFQRDPYGPTPTTYYMVWINAETPKDDSAPNRTRLSLAYTEDGKNWVYLGDIWRWETAYRTQTDGVGINHIVDPFIVITEDHVICGTGISEKLDNTSHNAQRQNIWTLEKASLPEGKKISAFEDITLGAPYYNDVMFAVDNGLFNGTSATTFEPDTTMNRAMFVTVLGRLEGAQVDNNTATEFTDVKAGEWYTGSVAWAAKNGIVNGMGNGIYGVTNTITVEQACTILYRYNGGKDGKLEGMKLTDFTDASSVSSWAADGVKWAVENGIYAGSDGKLDPTEAGSRALVATMFANYVKAFG